jgi:hypothetical protein
VPREMSERPFDVWHLPNVPLHRAPFGRLARGQASLLLFWKSSSRMHVEKYTALAAAQSLLITCMSTDWR